MTDNDIINSLECCAKTLSVGCKGCLFYKDDESPCISVLCKSTLDLINRQKAEIEMLKPFEKKMLMEVIETMTNEQIQFGFEAKSKVEQAKSEAIKEFAERLKENSTDIVLYGEIIPICRVERLVKEMTEQKE